MADESTYGFSKLDAEDLTQSIGSGDREFPEMRPRGQTNISSIRLYRFELLGDLDTGTASADIFEMDGTVVGSDDVLDPEAIFESLVTGNVGLCIKQDEIYYVIQAKCID